MLASLSVKYPQVRMMVFVSRGMPEETLNRLRGFRQISIHDAPLGDGTSPGLILKTLTEAIAPSASYEATLMAAMEPGSRSKVSERGESGRYQGLTSRLDAGDPRPDG